MDEQHYNHNTPSSSLQDSNPQSYPSRAPQKKRKESIKSLLSTLAILILAPLVALLLIAFVFQSYEVDGPSMEDTLQHQDRLIVLKTGRTISRITNQNYIPSRGDIIVFAKSGTVDPTAGGERQLIKRVIGLPNDRVTVRNGAVTIFNEEHPDGFDPDVVGSYADNIASRGGVSNIDTRVPEGHLFVMGDNRSNSLDSRTFGIIKSDEIVGRLALRIFPLDEIETF